ncbi:ATP-grasp domain-containing protein, partial [Nocardia wallacei]|uniref:D-alanine--D-alanine ligase family protein n=1 Tax=Nocardia wallacei TaxID=480035 RepID=UPI00245395E4
IDPARRAAGGEHELHSVGDERRDCGPRARAVRAPPPAGGGRPRPPPPPPPPRRYDSKVMIEEAVPGHEVGCAILGDGPDLVIGEVDRVALSHGFFRIHQENSPETGSENSTFIVPADISDDLRRRVRQTAETIYHALGCRGLARVDMFLTEDGRVVLNEVNTFPGMTSYSRYPRMMAAAGLPLPDLIDRLVSMTLHEGR